MVQTPEESSSASVTGPPSPGSPRAVNDGIRSCRASRRRSCSRRRDGEEELRRPSWPVASVQSSSPIAMSPDAVAVDVASATERA